MKCTQFYPVIMTDDVAGTARFYRDHFRFRPSFESDWYVHLQSSEDEKVNIAILQGDHETIPETARGRVSGLLINFAESVQVKRKVRNLSASYPDHPVNPV